MIPVGLRIDVDTLRGTRLGVPNLLALFAEQGIQASFFFSVGPDNMGRHLWRLLKPAFLMKMLRSKAAKLYGWDILLRGTFWPGPGIGKACAAQLRDADLAGHEVGLHAWDHHRWQAKLAKMDAAAIEKDLSKGYELMREILGHPPMAFASPGWRTTPATLTALQAFPFQYHSNCRGHSLFRLPAANNGPQGPLQFPTTLPTYDELIGVTCTNESYNEYLLERIRPDQLNVLTIHAEVEGILCLELFRSFLASAKQRKIRFLPLGQLVPSGELEEAELSQGMIEGREGWISIQTARA